MRHSNNHKELMDGVGDCGVPAWINGCPAGFCDRPAYGKQELSQQRYGRWERGQFFPGYSSALTCYQHGGPEKPDQQLLVASEVRDE